MGRTRPLLVAAFTCILLAGEAVATKQKIGETEPETQNPDAADHQNERTNKFIPNEDTTDPSTTSTPVQQSVTTAPGEIKVDGVLQGNTAVFTWSRTPESLPDPEYEIRYKSQLYACRRDAQYTPWASSTNRNMTLRTEPYSDLTLEVQIKGSSDAAEKTLDIPGKEPTSRVTRVRTTNRYLEATVEDNCMKHNGPNMHVQFVLKVSNEELQQHSSVIRKAVNITRGNTAKLYLKDLDLLPFTNYTVTVIPANALGNATDDSLIKEETFTTKPRKPGKVRNLKVVDDSPDSLKVTWSAPDDDPPKGILQGFKVQWEELPKGAGGKDKTVNRSTTSLVIRDLYPETTYNITVQAKNKGARERGDAVQVNGTTTQERAPPPVVDLKSTAENGTKSLHLNWRPSGIDTIAHYMVSLHEGETTIKKTNTTKTTVKFGGLTAGKENVARVRACNNREKCSSVTEVVAWTRPDPPQLKGTTSLLKQTDSTITIQLPSLTNPPGNHWILLKRKGQGRSGRKEQKEDIKKKAQEIVRRERMPRSKRTRRSLDRTFGSDTDLHIVAIIEDVGGGDNSVTLGGGENQGDAPLKGNSSYLVVIVTETKAGDYSEYYVCEPQTFKTSPYADEGTVLGMIAGICAAAVVVTVIATLLVLGCKNRRKKTVAAEENNYFTRVESPINETVDGNDKIPLQEAMNGKIMVKDKRKLDGDKHGLDKDVTQEDLYMNINHEISKKDLEMYLSKATFSAETTLEFNSVPAYMPGKTATTSRIPENARKNRYKNDVTYDDTRVKLPLYNNIPHSDYINANFVQDPSRRPAFIATQGPKDQSDDTIGAFWRMIWHTKCPMIVMVANLVEGGRVRGRWWWRW